MYDLTILHFTFCDGVRGCAVVVASDVMLLLIFKLTKHKAPTLGELGAEHESVVSGQGGTHSGGIDVYNVSVFWNLDALKF